MENKEFNYKEFFKEGAYKDKPRLISQVVILILLLVICGSLGLLYSDLFFLGLILIFLPALFSSIICLSYIQVGRDYSNKEFLKGFKNYFNPASPYYGSFDVWKGFLYSIAVALGCSLIFSYVYMTFFSGEDFYNSVLELTDAFSNNDFDLMTSLVEENEELSKFYLYNEIFSISGSILFQILRIGKFIFNVETRMLTSFLSPRRGTYVFKQIWKENRKIFLKDFLKYTWFITLSIVASYIVALVICLHFDLYQYCIIISSSVALCVGAIFFPYYLLFLEGLCSKNISIFKAQFKSNISQTLSNIDKSNSFNKQQKDDLERLMNEVDKLGEDIDDKVDSDDNNIN